LAQAQRELIQYQNQSRVLEAEIKKVEKAAKDKIKALRVQENEAHQRLSAVQKQEKHFIKTSAHILGYRDRVALLVKEGHTITSLREMPAVLDSYSREFLVTAAKDLRDLADTAETMANTYPDGALSVTASAVTDGDINGGAAASVVVGRVAAVERIYTPDILPGPNKQDAE
jgi:deoxyribose-phosphate aldolase